MNMFNQTSENEFWNLCKSIDTIAKESSYKEIDESTWNRLSDEVEKLEIFYRENQKNLYHIEHNYRSRLVWRMLAKGHPLAAIEEFKNSCIFLLKRHRVKPYSDKSLDGMSKSFKAKSQDIATYIKKNPQERNYTNCREWLEVMTGVLEELLRGIGNDRLLAQFLDTWWFPIIRRLQLQVLEFTNKLDKDYKSKSSVMELMAARLIDTIRELNNVIMNCFEGQFRCPYVLSLNNAIIFRLTKITFYLLLRKIYFDKTGYADLPTKLKGLLIQLEESAKEENANFKRYYRSLKHEDLSEKQKRSLQRENLGYEIDEKVCSYFRALYEEKDVFKAFQEIEKLYSHIISGVLTKRIHLSEYQLDYFADELAFLSLYVKLLLVRKDICRTRRDFFKRPEDWRDKMMNEIESKLEIAISMFKYEPLEQSSVEIKMITRALSGGLPVSIIAEWIKKIIEKGMLRKQESLSSSNIELKAFYECISRVQNSEKVIPYHKFSSEDESDPDIDILVGDSAVFVKNGYLDLQDINAVEREIRYARRNEIDCSFILVNFYRNMRDINKMLDLKIRWESRDYKVHIMDLRYVLERLISILRANDEWKYQGMRDVLKLVDY